MDATGRAPAGFYRAAEVAQMLRCSEWWVKEQARQRRIPFCWIGGSYLFTDEHITAIVHLFEVQPMEGCASPPSTGRTRRSGAATGPAGAGLVARVPRRARAAQDMEAA
ncbi:helix-turn-helix domain-containing protein [Actinoplanes sp. NPDC051633]|uniref:helix-turn-helix domain-containing protein n=1 Tax=Actinoplanes sp. NPDC051633 TaxID=3155670 RepID=UPI00343199BD